MNASILTPPAKLVPMCSFKSNTFTGLSATISCTKFIVLGPNQPRRVSTTCDVRAFTLVELLTVVAIIGILGVIACLWIPTALEKSRASRCIGNLRQIGMAYSLYAADHKGNVAEGWNSGTSPDSRPPYLFQALAPYLSGGRLTDSALAIPDNSLPSSWCPTFLSNYSPANVGHAASTSYAGNKYFSLGLLGRTANRKFNQLDRPDKTVLLMDSMGALVGGKYIGAAFKPNAGYGELSGIPDFHSNGANVLYADFHVIWIPNGSPDEPKYLYDATRPY